MPDRPGKGLFGWLGRQVGYVRKAIESDPANPPQKVIYRQNRTEEQEMPNQPGVKLRRTTIDEVIVQTNRVLPSPNARPEDEKT